jgi:hypothetical protein
MRVLLAVIIIVAAAIFLGYPPLIEDSDGECSALDQRFSDLASHDNSGLLTVGPLYGSSSSRPSAAGFARDRYPSLPPMLGCATAYWRSVFAAPSADAGQSSPPAPREAPPEPTQAIATEPASPGTASTISRDITPNGDPISPATIFTLPMDSVAVRVAYPGDRTRPARFQLLQGRAAIASCNADRSAPGTAWCKFNVSLRKGNYSISFTANNVLLGQFPFTVIGR